MLFGLIAVMLLAAASAFLSLSEISLAASSRVKLRPLAEKGSLQAARVLSFQDQPGLFSRRCRSG